MNVDPIEHISSEKNLHIDNQQGENSTQNDTTSKEVVNRIIKTKKTPMTPTRLYVYLFSLSIQHSNI
jgi:hypothetical protein